MKPSQDNLQQQKNQLITVSAPDKSPHAHYRQIDDLLPFITNQHLSNFILIPVCGLSWVLGFLYCNQQKISPIQSNYARYIIQIFSQLIILKMRGETLVFNNIKDFKLLMIRSLISGLNGMAASFFQMFLPLTVYYTINASTTIFAFILNYFLFGIVVTPNQRKSVAAAIIGIGLVINGRAIYSWLNSSYQFESNFDYGSSNLFVLSLMGLGVMAWSFIWAYGIIITGKHHASFNEFIFINAIVGFSMFCVMEMMIPIYNGDSSINHLFTSKPELFMKTLIYTGIPLAFANYLFNGGVFISSNTGVSTMLIQVNILYVYVISTIRYDQQINIVCLFGAIILVGSIYVVLFHK